MQEIKKSRKDRKRNVIVRKNEDIEEEEDQSSD